MTQRSRGWCFTINNYILKDFSDVYTLSLNVRYLIVGAEVAPTTLTKHLQGYAYFDNPRTLHSVSKALPRANLRAARGTPDQNETYCSKSGDIYEVGEKPAPGARVDLGYVRELIAEKGVDDGLTAVMEIASNMQQVTYAKQYVQHLLKKKKRNWVTEVIWICGPKGSGKSRMVWDAHPDLYQKDESKWWDDYYGEPVVLIDDYRKSHFKQTGDAYTYLLRLLDRYAMRIQTKGGYVQLTAKKIYITSIEDPYVMFANFSDPPEQLYRRITTIITKNADGTMTQRSGNNRPTSPVPEIPSVLMMSDPWVRALANKEKEEKKV